MLFYFAGEDRMRCRICFSVHDSAREDDSCFFDKTEALISSPRRDRFNVRKTRIFPMKFRFFFLLIFFAVFSGFFLVSAIAADASGDRFAWLDISRISDRSDLEAVTLGKEWQFVPGKPGSSWMTAFQKGIPFSLNGSLVNLDTLSGIRGRALQPFSFGT